MPTPVNAAEIADDLAARNQVKTGTVSSQRREMILSDTKSELMLKLGRQPTSDEMVAAANAKLTARRAVRPPSCPPAERKWWRRTSRPHLLSDPRRSGL